MLGKTPLQAKSGAWAETPEGSTEALGAVPDLRDSREHVVTHSLRCP